MALPQPVYTKTAGFNLSTDKRAHARAAYHETPDGLLGLPNLGKKKSKTDRDVGQYYQRPNSSSAASRKLDYNDNNEVFERLYA